MHQLLGGVCSGGEGAELLGHGTMPCLSLGHHCIEGQGFMLRGWIQPRWHASWKQRLASVIMLITVIAIPLGNKKGCTSQCVHLSVAISLFPAGQQQYGLCGYVDYMRRSCTLLPSSDSCPGGSGPVTQEGFLTCQLCFKCLLHGWSLLSLSIKWSTQLQVESHPCGLVTAVLNKNTFGLCLSLGSISSAKTLLQNNPK